MVSREAVNWGRIGVLAGFYWLRAIQDIAKYLTGSQGVGGSNPLVPTILRGLRFYAVGSFLFCVNFAPILAFTSPLPGKQKPRAI